jgi:hypothetical protein
MFALRYSVVVDEDATVFAPLFIADRFMALRVHLEIK